MKIAVVTPVGPDYNVDHLLDCTVSVAVQQHPCTHFIVGDGVRKTEFDNVGIPTDHMISLPHPAGDIGSTPRAIGSAYAFGQGFDAVAWLDADNWYCPDHIKKLVRHHHFTGKPVVASGRYVCRHSGDQLSPCVEQIEGSGFYDTNTMMVTRHMKGAATWWAALEDDKHIVGDRLISQLMTELSLLSCHYEPTCVYRSRLKFHYDHYGWEVEKGLKLEVKQWKP